MTNKPISDKAQVQPIFELFWPACATVVPPNTCKRPQSAYGWAMSFTKPANEPVPLGQLVKEDRLKAQLDQAQLAERLRRAGQTTKLVASNGRPIDPDNTWISRLERNRFREPLPGPLVEAIADALEVGPARRAQYLLANRHLASDFAVHLPSRRSVMDARDFLERLADRVTRDRGGLLIALMTAPPRGATDGDMAGRIARLVGMGLTLVALAPYRDPEEGDSFAATIVESLRDLKNAVRARLTDPAHIHRVQVFRPLDYLRSRPQVGVETRELLYVRPAAAHRGGRGIEDLRRYVLACSVSLEQDVALVGDDRTQVLVDIDGESVLEEPVGHMGLWRFLRLVRQIVDTWDHFGSDGQSWPAKLEPYWERLAGKS